MKYSKPLLHSLLSPTVSGDSRSCVGGSVASGLSACVVGPDDGTSQCRNGISADTWCRAGTAARPGPQDRCDAGTAPTSFCVTGWDDS